MDKIQTSCKQVNISPNKYNFLLVNNLELKKKKIVLLSFFLSFSNWLATQDDVQALVDMGADTYRFSISWSRILPGIFFF